MEQIFREGLKIGFLQGDPGALKDLAQSFAIAAADTLQLGLGIGGEENSQGIAIPQIFVAAIAAFNDGDGAGRQLPGLTQGLGVAAEGTVGHRLAQGEGQQHLLGKPLPIHIFTGCGKALLGALAWTEEKVIHGNDVAVQLLL